MTTNTIWISYDLGVRGDYEGLYLWLDEHKAKECGDSVAVLSYRYTGELLDHLKADLKESVATDKRTRIYVIWRDRSTKSVRGRFVFGGRRSAAWAGYALTDTTTTDEES